MKIPLTLARSYERFARGDRITEGYAGFRDSREHVTAQVNTLATWRALRSEPTSVSTGWDKMRRLEDEGIAAVTCDWREPGPFCFNQYLTLPEVDGAAQAAFCESAVTTLGPQLRDAISRVHPDDVSPSSVVYPVSKGKGAPFWLTGNDAWAAYAMYQLERVALDSVEELSPFPVLLTLYKRIQGSAKQRRRWAWTGENGPMRAGELRQWPKARKVMGYPFHRNIRLAGFTSVLFNAFRASALQLLGSQFLLLRPVAEAIELTRRLTVQGYSMYAEDASQHDDTVGFRLFESIGQVAISAFSEAGPSWMMRHPILNAAAAHGVLIGDLAMPLAYPPITTDLIPRILPRTQGLTSGQNSTAVMTSLVRACDVASRLNSLGIRGCACFITGDDTLIAFPTAADRDKYSTAFGDPEASRRVDGFATTEEGDATFLRKNCLTGSGYGHQAVLNTINREDGHEPRTVGLSIVAAYARLETLDTHPDRFTIIRILTDPSCVGRTWAAAFQTALHLTPSHLVQIAQHAAAEEARMPGGASGRSIESILMALESLGGTSPRATTLRELSQALTSAVPERSWVPISQFEYAADRLDPNVSRRRLAQRGANLKSVEARLITAEEATTYATPTEQ